MNVLIERVYLKEATPGSLYLGPEAQFLLCKTLELPNKGNRKGISCIPEGDYVMIKEADSPKHHYPHFRILNVVGRDGILMHYGNFTKDILGCILPGSAHADLDRDGLPDVVESSVTLAKLYNSFPESVHLTITEKKKK